MLSVLNCYAGDMNSGFCSTWRRAKGSGRKVNECILKYHLSLFRILSVQY